MRRLALATVAFTSACGREPDTGLSTGPGVTSASLTSSSTGDASSSSSSSTSGADDGSAGVSSSSDTVPDMGLIPDFGSVQPPGCKGKIDFLFLISRNGTMKTEQAQLLSSLPGFLATIEATFPSFDTHIMVANPDGDWPGWNCNTPEFCGTKPYICSWAPGFECGLETWDSIEPCEQTLGAGVLYNVGSNSPNKPCVLAEGRRYIAVPGEPDPAAAFACISPVGTSGPEAAVGDALVAAVSPALNMEGGCNAGFLRSDALLVVTMITDRQDQASKTQPADWYDAVVKAKGDAGAVVMLAIQPQGLPRGESEQPGCTYDLYNESYLRQLIEMFPFHAEGNTCAPSYVPFFETAAGRVAEACAAFIPG